MYSNLAYLLSLGSVFGFKICRNSLIHPFIYSTFSDASSLLAAMLGTRSTDLNHIVPVLKGSRSREV